MKTIKIKFIGFWDGFNPEIQTFYQIMKKYYDVKICDDADYIICSLFGDKYEYCKYPQVRIFFSGENYVPDFNLVDYAISPYPILFSDRHFYLPNFIDKYHHCELLEERHQRYTMDFVKQKEYFANFIASHESEHNYRGDFFKKLCEYKRVESPGTYLNNMNPDISVNFYDTSKTDFQRKSKFTLCFESTKHEGFITEKITDAFYAETIPVYYGSDTINDYFNPKAFINVSSFSSFDDAIEKIKELDQDDEKYIAMINEPIFTNGFSPKAVLEKQEKFIKNIFDQSLETAYRRSKVYWPQKYNDYLAKKAETKPYSLKENIKANWNMALKKIKGIKRDDIKIN